MKKTLRSLFILALAATPAFSAFADEAKRVIVVTVTTGFRHSSIPYAEKTLQKLADESKAFTIVEFVRQPDVQVPKPPNKPRPLEVSGITLSAGAYMILGPTDLSADASDKGSASHDADTQGDKKALAEWEKANDHHDANMKKYDDALAAFGFTTSPGSHFILAPKPKDLAADASEKDKARHDADMKDYEGVLAQWTKAKAHYDADMKKYDEAMEKWTPEVQNEAKEKQEQFDFEAKRNLEKLSPSNLAAEHIDGVIFANTTGDLPLPDRDGFIQWIQDGHGFVAMHSGSDTLHHFPGYIEMLGGEFETHKFQVPADLVAADTENPANAGLGSAWNIKQEEVYFIKNQDRSKVHSVWFLRHNPNDPNAAGFFPVSWTKAAGKGRVFYTSLGHREDLWSDDPEMKGRVNSVEISKQYQAHILGGIKWALGLVPGSDEPNPEVK